LYSIARSHLGPNATSLQIEAEGQRFLKEWRKTAYHGPDPKAYEKLLHNEQRALAANSTPAAMGLAVTGTLRLLTIAVEFNGSDTAANFSHPASVFGDRTCITETVTFNGPLHNQIQAPGPRDNATLWRPQFEKHHFEQVVLSTTGITERVRLDLTDPEDGKPGIDVSGASMRNYYDEVSGGKVKFDAGPKGIIAWIQVPHSEGYYAANACLAGDPGRIQSMNGLPQNPSFPSGVSQLLKDTVDSINASDPNFPWADYDTDGNGVIDHVVLFHAGEDRSGGGGVQGYQAIWAHRGNVGGGGYVTDDRGTPDPSDDIKLDGYTAQYENVDTGVLVHEFGHDLGHPDLYDTSGLDESDVVWWDLMSTGSNTGKLVGALPTHMSAWTKTALGWADPQIVSPTSTAQTIQLGQTSHPPAGTTQAVRINLPPTVVTDTLLLPGSTQAWWTNNDAAWADIRLTRDLNLTGVTAPISISFDLDGAAELDWDYLFLEVSVDGGATYTQTKGFEVGSNTELTTPDGYPDPNGRLHDYGGLRYGYTGDTGGWIRAYHNLSAYAGQNIKLRFRYATDAAFQERGYFVDNIVIRAGANVLLNDPVEGGNANGWTPEVKSFVVGELPSAGWVLSNGVRILPMYYLLEWRNADGFDKGLLYTYHTIFNNAATATTPGEFRVDRVPSNIPGMLVWLRDTRFGGEPFNADNSVVNTGNQFIAPSSDGPKGGLLLVDSHPDPLRAPANSTIDFGFGAVPFPPDDNYNGRVQTTNAAFTTQSTRPLTLTLASGTEQAATTVLTPTLYAAQPAISGFHDALGYYPGVEALPQPVTTFSDPATSPFLRKKGYAFSDPDASVVVPAKDYYPPRTPPGFTGAGFETAPPAANVSTFETIIGHTDGSVETWNVGDPIGVNVTGEQTGNPGSYGVQLGYHFQIIGRAPNGSYGTVRLWNGSYAGQASTAFAGGASMTQPLTVTVGLQNTGSPASLTLYSDFDESKATYIEGSATNGAVPVRASQAQVEAALRSGGTSALRAMAVAPGQATAVVWSSPGAMETGDTASFSYSLSRKTGAPAVKITNHVFGPSFSGDSVAQFGSTLFVPVSRK
jgi:immune inhibitor A